MENEQEVPPPEAKPAEETPTAAKPSLLSKILNQKEHDLLDLIKTRIVDYTFTGDYEEGFPKTCKIRRWSYGHSIELLPETIGIVGEVIGTLTSLAGKRTVDMELNGIVDDIFYIIAAPENVAKYSSLLAKIGKILQRTLDTVKDQKIIVNDLELVDIIAISKIVMSQNLGVILKNVKTAPENAEPTKTKDESGQK